MNKKAIENLWLVANKERGTFNLAGIYRLMLHVLFFKYIEMECKSYDERFSIAYLSLLYGKMIYADDVIKYLETVEDELGIQDYIVSGEMRKLLSEAETDSVRVIFEAMNRIEFENGDELYQVTQSLLNKFSVAEWGITAEVSTNLSLCKLEARLLECKEGMSVYDGFCGCGSSVNEVAMNKGIVYMQDVKGSVLALATIVALLKGNKIGAIKCGDSFLNPLNEEKFDRVVCEPPFAGKYSKEYIASLSEDNCILTESLESRSIALRHAIARLKPDGIAAVLVPTGLLFNVGKMTEIREVIISNYLDTVIEFPGGLMPGTAVTTALLILKGNKKDKDVYMINAKEFGIKGEDKASLILPDESIDKISTLYESREAIEGISRVVEFEELAKNEFNLCTTRYVELLPEDTIVINNNAEYMSKYKQLVDELSELDKKLAMIRKRWG